MPAPPVLRPWRKLGQENAVDQRHPDLERVRHAGPIGIAQQLVTHVKRRFERRDTGKCAARPRVKLGIDQAQRLEPPQAVLDCVAVEHLAEVPGHEQSATQKIRAGIGPAVFEEAGRFWVRTDAIGQPPRDFSRQKSE